MREAFATNESNLVRASAPKPCQNPPSDVAQWSRTLIFEFTFWLNCVVGGNAALGPVYNQATQASLCCVAASKLALHLSCKKEKVGSELPGRKSDPCCLQLVGTIHPLARNSNQETAKSHSAMLKPYLAAF
ncbi:uncharacterized protein UTRI_03835 [Ustilago trichophora]|uniref:Uncharacterized protein n=1 Tax=Ustilago trichophora TaxID=86804 RepID=A0A5C3E4R4_9BASI|nr:uncharacterized protein UTRI_03835 [Ustilago trichophora]